ncbi:MAG: serine/threonine protein kinase [Cocleimonas sp.]|nr:serine/threonine protein kinase [Cocleimonas sp.]
MSMIQIPNYTVKKVIGQGGMALVYLATQDMLSREVALKVLMPDMMKDDNLRKSFLNEGKIVASLKHPNIVSIFDIGVVGDSIFYMSMEYICGGTLKEKLLKEKFSYNAAIKALEEISEGLSYAHEQGYIHRDIKPGNILFRDDGSAVLTDFGIAKLQDTSGDLTRLGLTAGTAQYMSPEQAQSSKLDSRSDIYSLGLVFFEILTGKKAFGFDTHHQAIHLHTTAPPPKLPKEYAFLQKVINNVLAKKPKDRYQTVLEFVRAIKNAGQPTVTATGSTIHTDETIIHGAKPSFIKRIKQKPFSLLLTLFAGLFTVGAIVFSIINYPSKATKIDKPIKVTVKTIEETSTPKPQNISLPQVKPKTEQATLKNMDDEPKCNNKKRGKVFINDVLVSSNTINKNNDGACDNERNNKIAITSKPQIIDHFAPKCKNLSSLIKESLSIISDNDFFGMTAHDSGNSWLCAQKDLYKQLDIFKAAIQKGDYDTLDKFIYPPIKKGRSLESLAKIIMLPYLPSDKVTTHSQIIELPFRKYSKGIYAKIPSIIAMSMDLSLSQKDLNENIKNGRLKKAQKTAAKTLKKKYGAFEIYFKKGTLEATFYKKGQALAIYEVDHGWSIMTYDSKSLKKIKKDLPKEILRYLTN